MPAQIPASVQPLLDEYLTAVARELPGLVIAFYVHGSIALCDFQPKYSDIDFVAVISRHAGDSDVARLTTIHNDLKAKYTQNPLSGSYLQPEDLGRLSDAIVAAPYFQDGVMQRGHFDINAVTWWVLKNRGLALLGAPATELPITVDVDRMIADMHRNMNDYWAQYTRKPARMVALLSDWGIQWAIPGVLRQFFTFEERAITSKTGACEYALRHVPARWHRIIQEAINIRNGREARLYGFAPLRALDAYGFLRYIIARCNAGM